MSDASEDDDQPQMHDGVAIRGYCRGEPIPDLGLLERERWREVLAPLSEMTRQQARATVRTPDDAQAVAGLIGSLWLDDAAARERALGAPPPRIPAGVAPRAEGSRQVNFRLGPTEHAQLCAAADLFGIRPTTLARVLTVQGVSRALYEERRERLRQEASER